MKKRNILLLEPNYKNKYPPIGLMKLATYHRQLGDKVIFYKGDLKQFILEEIFDDLSKRLKKIDSSPNWKINKKLVIEYIKTGKKHLLSEIIQSSKYHIALTHWLILYKDYYRKKKYFENPKWDRICITTLFTFHWKITIETIEFAKKLVKTENELKVGGVLATVLTDELYKVTGIKPHKGLLNKPGVLDNNDIIIDELPLDYSILDEIDYKYPENNGYYGYMTRGCIRNCTFCAVPRIEPDFNPYISLKNKLNITNKLFGEKRNLLLLDNNVLASNRFEEIINEIKQSGFINGAKYIEPNQLEITIKNLKSGYNDRAYTRKAFFLIQDLLKRLKNNSKQDLYNLLVEYQLLSIDTTTKEKIIKIYPKIREVYEKYRNKAPKRRYVDFNQGIDARLINDENMKLLSEIPINPLRIAFDNMKYEKIYSKAIHLAAKYGIKNLSNYLLYNENEKPVELYQRLKINIELCEALDINIYSFPMKYHPVNGEEWYKNRNYIGLFWNKKFIRAVQTILNATKGKIGRGKSFFYEAFGADENDFFKLLYMPEPYILFRFFFKDKGYTDKWWNEFNSFNNSDKENVKKIIHTNDFKDISRYTTNTAIIKFINEHYLISRGDIKNPNSIYYQEKKEYDKLKSIANQAHLQFINSTVQSKIDKKFVFQSNNF